MYQGSIKNILPKKRKQTANKKAAAPSSYNKGAALFYFLRNIS